MDTRLRIPGTRAFMRVAAATPLDCVDLLAETLIVIAYGGGASSVVFDADALKNALGAKWPAVDRALSEIAPASAHAAIKALTAQSGPLADAASVYAEAEAKLVEADDAAARAAIVMVLVQARIAAIVER